MGSLKDIVPEKVGKIEAVAANTDPAFQGMPAQTLPGSLLMPATIQNFEGMSASGHIPPGTCGEAGRHHYVQMVNRQTAVFDKTGNILFGPVDSNTLWAGFGGICETQNQGDPVVVYDQLANRWLISQFAYVSPNVHLECIAVSETDDPTGAYYRYSYSFPAFNDSGTRSYEVLREGVVLVSNIPYGTTSLKDNSAQKNQDYSYSVRYLNGCSLNATTTGVHKVRPR